MEIRVSVSLKDSCNHDCRTPPCSPPPPPPPPPPPITSNHPPSTFLIIMFCGLAVSFSFICYLTCATRYRIRQRNHEHTDHETHEDFVNEDLGPVTHHPIWLINTIGLDQSQIDSIQVFKYKRDEKLIEGTDCSVCLSEFEEDESLRLLPKCSHAFHVPCIDTWLRSHKNCPLCRAPIIKNTNDQTESAIIELNLTESSSTSVEIETPVNDSETIDDHHVVEVENNGEVVKTSGIEDETSSTDHHTQGEELAAMRRSFSNNQLVVSKNPSSMTKSEHKLKGSSSNVYIRHKVIGHPLLKANSFTSKSGHHNQSY